MAYDKPIKNTKIYDLHRKNPPFPVNQPEISTERMKWIICLSNVHYISLVQTSLIEALPDSEFKQDGLVIMVSSYPPEANFDNNKVLAIVQKHDPLAKLL